MTAEVVLARSWRARRWLVKSVAAGRLFLTPADIEFRPNRLERLLGRRSWRLPVRKVTNASLDEGDPWRVSPRPWLRIDTASESVYFLVRRPNEVRAALLAVQDRIGPTPSGFPSEATKNASPRPGWPAQLWLGIGVGFTLQGAVVLTSSHPLWEKALSALLLLVVAGTTFSDLFRTYLRRRKVSSSA